MKVIKKIQVSSGITQHDFKEDLISAIKLKLKVILLILSPKPIFLARISTGSYTTAGTTKN